MHPCLRLVEIIENIVDLLDDSADCQIALATAASLARTCKFFQEPALDVLWKRQTTLFNLLQLLPSDSWVSTCGPTPSVPPSLTSTRKLLPEECARVYFYARRIKCLTNHEDAAKYPTSDMYHILQQCSSDGHPLLEQLDTIIVTFQSQLQGALPIIGHKLTSLSLTTGGDFGLDVMNTVRRRWPCLEKLCYHGPLWETNQPFSVLLRSFNHLRVCILPTFPLDAATLSHLASLPLLYKLDAAVFQVSFSNLASIMNPFPSMLHLSVYAGLPEMYIPIAEIFRWVALKSLCIRIGPNTTAFHDLISSLVSGDLPLSLTSLEMFVRYRPTPNPVAIPRRTFGTLTTFHRLTRIKIIVGLSIELLDDDLIEEMARGWPNMEIVQPWYLSWLNPAKVTLRGPASLVQHCPKLKEIKLAFTATTPHPSLLDSIIHSKTFNHNITRFDISWSTIETSDPSMIAQFLVALFPKLQAVERPYNFDSELSEPYIELWAEVSTFVRAIQGGTAAV